MSRRRRRNGHKMQYKTVDWYILTVLAYCVDAPLSNHWISQSTNQSHTQPFVPNICLLIMHSYFPSYMLAIKTEVEKRHAILTFHITVNSNFVLQYNVRCTWRTCVASLALLIYWRHQKSHIWLASGLTLIITCKRGVAEYTVMDDSAFLQEKIIFGRQKS